MWSPSPMKSLSVVLVALLAVLVPAASATGPLVDERDARGDVRITGVDGLSRADRRSVDLHRLKVMREGRSVRFVMRLRRVVGPADQFDQYLFFDYSNGEEFGQVMVRAARMRATAGLEGARTPSGFAACRVTPVVDLRRTRLTVVVPRRCVAVNPVKVSATAYTTPLGRRGGYDLWSRDDLRVPGTVDLVPERP